MLAYLLASLAPVPPLAATAIIASGLTYGGMSARPLYRHWRMRRHTAQQRRQLRWPLAGCGRVTDAQWQAGVRCLLAQAGMRAEYTEDRWGARHYRLTPRQQSDTNPTLDSVETTAAVTPLIARPAADETPEAAHVQGDEGEQTHA